MLRVSAKQGRVPRGSPPTGPLPKGIPALVIHGELDETVALTNVLEWARPQEQPIIVVPGADHFFHGKLHVIRDIISTTWAPL